MQNSYVLRCSQHLGSSKKNVGLFVTKNVANWNFLANKSGGKWGTHPKYIYIYVYIAYLLCKVLPHKNETHKTEQQLHSSKRSKGYALKDLPSHGFGESPHTHSSNCLSSTHFHFLRSAKNGCVSAEVYLQGLSVGLATLGGSDGWLRFILDPSMDEAGKVVRLRLVNEMIVNL